MLWCALGVTTALTTVARVSKAQEGAPTPNGDVTADKPAAEGDDASESGMRHAISAQVLETYSTNLYHEQKRHENDFNRNGPGERYEGMEGPGDFITEASVEGGLKWKLDKGRFAKASLGAGYVFHVYNAIANYFELSAGGHYDVARHDRLMLDVDVIPRRFRKNYSISYDANGNKFWQHAYYWEVQPSLGYRHLWPAHWGTELTYELGIRRYEDPHGNRSVTSNGLTLLVTHDFKRVTLGVGIEGAIGTTPSGLEFGIPVERSYRDITPIATLDAALPHGFSLGVDLEYRIRHYTTDERANDTYFDRTDRRWDLELKGKKRLGDVFAVVADAGWIRNDTNRQDHPNVDPTDLAYQEFLVGLGIEATL